MDLITPEFGLIVWQTVTFLVLLFLLAKFAWKPILKLVNDREESINKALQSAEDARKEMENLQADNQKLLKEAREERDAIIKEARTIKEKMIADASEEAGEKAAMMIEKAQQSITAEKQAALAEIKAEVASLSLEIAEKVVKKELSNKDDQMKLVDGMLENVKLN